MRNIFFVLLPVIITVAVFAEEEIIADIVDAVNVVDTTIDTVDIVDIIDIIDSADVTDIAGDTDTTDAMNALSVIDIADITDTANIADTAAVNLAAPRLYGTFWGFGFGLSIGSVPIFNMWRNSLPQTIENLGLTPRFGIDGDLFPGDVSLLRYSITEAPDEFNFTIPFSVALYRINGDRTFSFALSFFHNSKQFQAAVSTFEFGSIDTLSRRVSMYQTLSYTSLAIEASYFREISPMFFSIDGSQKTYFSLTAGVSPVNYFTRSGGIRNYAPEDDLRMEAVADTLKKHFSTLSSNGMGVSWRMGIATLRNFSQGGGLKFGLYYGGAYAANFQNDGKKITEDQIDTSEGVFGNPLEFISSRIEFNAVFLIPRSKRDKQNGNAIDMAGTEQ